MGGAQTIGGVVNKFERLRAAFPTVDIIVTGHHHRSIVVKENRIFFWPVSRPVKGSHIVREERDMYIISSGGYMSAYIDLKNRRDGSPVSTYVEDKMLKPVALGPAIIEVGVDRYHKSIKGCTYHTTKPHINVLV